MVTASSCEALAFSPMVKVSDDRLGALDLFSTQDTKMSVLWLISVTAGRRARFLKSFQERLKPSLKWWQSGRVLVTS